MTNKKKSISKLFSVMLVLLIAVSGLITPKSSLAAAPAGIPSQIALSIGGGAEAGKTAMGFNWVTDHGDQFRNYLWYLTEPGGWCKNKRHHDDTRSDK